MKPALSTREAARVELVRSAVLEPDSLERAFMHAARLSARTLRVERVSIWVFENQETRIRCRLLYALTGDRELPPEVIELAGCPTYAAAIRSHRTVAADDVLSDPRTLELKDYLERHGITSMLDSPIFQQGKPVGIVCHEHVGPLRSWSKEEKGFASSVADMLGLYLEQAETQHAYRSLLENQAELERARVMESVGRMAAAVAHDFNNVLSAIALRSDLGRLPGSDPASRARYGEEMAALVEQGARLVRQLLAVARQERPTKQVVDLAQVVRGLRPFLQTLETDGIAVTTQLPSEPVRVHLERAPLEQVITNLAVNARDAMLGGGRLLLEVSRVPAAQANRELVRLRVLDTGVGMDAHTQERIFEPYFTTKGEGRGLGLGLATVYRIVRGSEGTIHVKSALGEGTEFRVEWPLVES